MGVSLVGATTGRTLHVDSLSPDVPSYELVEVLVGGQVKAFAMLEDRPDGLHFGGLQSVSAGSHLPSIGDGKADFTARGVAATSAKLVWGWSDESASPFSPIWEATDAGGRVSYLTPADQIESSIHLTSPSE